MPAALQMPVHAMREDNSGCGKLPRGQAGDARNARSKRQQAGFSLLELLIAVVVVGVLAAIAYPSYVEYMNKARRADAKGPLMNAVNNQEQFLLDHNQFASNMTLLGYPANPSISPEGYYSVAVATSGCGTAPCYRFTATPVGGKAQASDAKCTSFSIDSTGNKVATGTTASKCW